MNRHHRLFWRRNKKKIKIALLFLLGYILGLSFILMHSPARADEMISPLPENYIPVTPTSTPTPTPSVEPTPTPLYEGKVSYYSHAGCLGCSENQTMGNGEAFDEDAMTIAIPCEDILDRKHRYNTQVLVRNVDTGKAVQARITDCGGFSKYNRVADVSKGIYTLLGIKTDRTNIRIEKL